MTLNIEDVSSWGVRLVWNCGILMGCLATHVRTHLLAMADAKNIAEYCHLIQFGGSVWLCDEAVIRRLLVRVQLWQNSHVFVGP